MKTNRYIVIALLLSIFVSSCEDGFLKQDPQTSLSSEQVFEKPENVQAFVYGLYYQWRATRVNRKGFYTILGTDEAQQGEYQVRTNAMQAAFDKYDGYYDSENTSIAEAWNIRWPVAVQASEGLWHIDRLLKSASADEAEQYKVFLGQISFYRACILFELTQYWGKLPLPNIVDGQNQLGPRKELQEVYKMITDDLKVSLTYLSEKRAADGRIPTIWAAKMLLAKVYMSAPVESGYRDFGEAQILLEDLKSRGGFVLENNYADLFDANKVMGNLPSQASTEEIFTFYFNNVWPDSNEAQWYAGTRACSGDPNCMYGGYDFKKFEDVRIDGTKSFYYTGGNMYYFRYADALLMLAECMNETGNTSGAVTLVNTTVRSRAFGGTVPAQYVWDTGMSAEEFRTKILDERMRELACEGWRRMDLVRTGHFEEYVKVRNRWQALAPTIGTQHRLFPVPMVEIKQNPHLQGDQNPGLN